MSRRLLDGKRPEPPPEANKGGRPKGSPILEADPEITQKIAQFLRIGSYVEIAAAVNGIGYGTLRQWVIKGREAPESQYGAFRMAVEKAIAEAQIRDLAVIDQHTNGRDAQYAMEPALDPDGNPVMEPVVDKNGKVQLDGNGNSIMRPTMKVARDPEGKPVVIRSEIKSDWRAGAWKLERRFWKMWGRSEIEQPSVMDAQEDSKPQEREAISLEQKKRKMQEVKQLAKLLENLEDDEYSK